MLLPHALARLLLLAALGGCCVGRPARLLVGDYSLSGVAVIMERVMLDRSSHRELAVRTPAGTQVPVHLPDQRALRELRTGMHVTLSGRWLAGSSGSSAAAGGAAGRRGFEAVAVQASRDRVAPRLLASVPAAGGGRAAAAKGSSQMVVSSNPLAYDDLSMLVIPIQAGTSRAGCPNTQPPFFDPADVKRAIFESKGSDQTLGSVVRQCSYGRSRVTPRSTLVTNLVELPCSGTTKGVAWSMSTCEQVDLDGVANAAENALRARNIDVDSYRHRVFLMPPGACQIVGFGQVGCDRTLGGCRAWIGGWHWISAQAILHEVSHHYSLDHAGVVRDGQFQEYGDETCSMAYCCAYRCFNTPHAWQLGWISLQQLDGASLAPGQTVTATLPSQSIDRAAGGGLRRGLRVLPTWAPGVDPVYLGFRTRAGGDVALTDGGANKLSIYTSAIAHPDDARMTNWEAALTAGQSWAHPTAGLVVRMRSIVNGTAAVVTVCRKGGAETFDSCQAGRDMDCNGLAGINDRACQAIYRRRRAKKAAAAPVRRALLGQQAAS